MKRNNSITTICALISAFPLVGAAKLQIVSSQGVPLREVVAGASCLVEVVVTGNAKVTKRPTIEGLTPEQIISERSSTHMFITNGEQKSEQHLGYLVNFSKPGTYSIGPARVETDGGTITSDSVTITVQDAPKESKSSGHQAAFARWKIAKEKLFVGETVPYSLRFYYTDPKTAQVGLQGTDQAEHLIFTQEQPRQTTEKIGSITYSVIELSGRVTPTETGTLTLPRALFSYTQPNKDEQQAQWGWQSATVMSMFGGFGERKQALASALPFTVTTIPQAQHPVHGVGNIKKVTFTATITKAKQGDPITCTLTIDGAFEPTLVKTPELTLPEALRVYPSSTKDTGTYPTITKTCEYILQSTESGKVTIPAQKFFFFNPQTKTFQTFTTKPIQLTITPNPHASYEPPVQQKQQETTDDTKTEPAQEAVPSTPQPEQITLGWEVWWVPPLWLFLLLVVVPVIWYFTRAFFIRSFKRFVIYRTQMRLLKHSARKLQQAVEDENPHLFWQTLQTLAQALLPPAPSWTAPEMLSYLKTQGWSDDDCATWEQLWEQSSRATFFIADKNEQRELKEKSSMIIKRIEQTLVRKPWHHFFS